MNTLKKTALRHALFELLPKFTGFVVSFQIVGMMWIEHHRIFRYIGQYDGGLLWRNLLMLLCVSFVPFPTALFSEFYFSRTAFVLYTASFACVALTKLWIWHYAVGNGLVGASVSEAVRNVSAVVHGPCQWLVRWQSFFRCSAYFWRQLPSR